MTDSLKSVLKARTPKPVLGTMGADRPVRVAFVLLDQFSLTSFSTALDVLSTGAILERGLDYLLSIWSLDGGPVASDVGVAIDTQQLALGRLQSQILVVVGGHRVRLVSDPDLNRVLRRAARERSMICGLWNAAFHLADAGLLEDQPSICHPESLAPIREYYPNLELGTAGHALGQRIGTCADASSVLDLMLAAMQVCTLSQTDAETRIKQLHQPERHTATPSPVGHRPLPRLLNVALELMEEHIEEPLEMNSIAARVGISRRQLERRFVQHFNASPVRYYLELRLTRARQLIVQSNRSLTDVALATGFVSYPHFYRRFKELFGLPPQTFRERYDIQHSPRSTLYAAAPPN